MKYNNTKNRISLSFLLVTIFASLTVDLPSVSAAGGAFDITFDGNGRLATDFDGGGDTAYDIAIQTDGKIVAVGETSSGIGLCALARYNPNGSLDTSFGGDGRVTILVAGLPDCVLEAVAIQTDGKIVAAGRVFNPGGFFNVMAVVRVLPNGDPDTTFSGDGVITGLSFLGPAEIHALAIQPNGSIVVAGDVNTTDMAVARLTSAGVLDTTFSADGVTTIDFGGTTGESAEGVHILADGKILIGGTANPANNTTRNFALARLNINGSLDATFDLDGKVTTDIPGTGEEVRYLKVQSDGKIILAGHDGTFLTLARYNANGTLDDTFNGNGVVVTNGSGAPNTANEIALQSDGKIVVAGQMQTADFYILRYNPNGSLDAGFGNNGILISDMTNGSSDTSNAVAIQADGKIVVAGSTRNATVGATTNFCVARYLPSGAASPFDFDGDRKTDPSVYRPSMGDWYLLNTTTGFRALHFGLPSDIMVPADYTGDGKTDMAVWRPSDSIWYVLRSEDNTFYGAGFGANGDVPAPGDYDGDGRADLVVIRPGASQSYWFLQQSTAGFAVVPFGLQGDVPTLGDYDGDGKNDVAVYRPLVGAWFRFNSSNGSFLGVGFGTTGDKVVPADYTGDGKTDLAVFRPSNNIWFILRSEDNSLTGGAFGATGDLPSPGDYDGDGKADLGVYRLGATPGAQSVFYVLQTTAGFNTIPWGLGEDRPVPGAYVY